VVDSEGSWLVQGENLSEVWVGRETLCGSFYSKQHRILRTSQLTAFRSIERHIRGLSDSNH
jgi:hypothetical protein